MSLRNDFRRVSVLNYASLCLTLLILVGMMKSKFVVKVLLPILKYGIAVLLGYFGGDYLPNV